MPEVISIEYANDTNGHFVSNANLSNVEMKNLDMAGSQVVVLHDPVEAQMLRITIEEFKQSPCAKIELLGCQKSSCLDQNECEVDNGYCDHLCHNAQGSYSCSCTEGYDLFKMDGQQGIFLKEGETGYNNLDSVRFNKVMWIHLIIILLVYCYRPVFLVGVPSWHPQKTERLFPRWTTSNTRKLSNFNVNLDINCMVLVSWNVDRTKSGTEQSLLVHV